jgi:hypothetical protein
MKYSLRSLMIELAIAPPVVP